MSTPHICGPLGSYGAWSRMVRSPLVWLGEPDPIKSMDDLRDEDYELANIREFFELWLAYGLDLGRDYTTAQIVEAACPPHTPNNYAPQAFNGFCCVWLPPRTHRISSRQIGWDGGCAGLQGGSLVSTT